jgi:proline dehydrogenase
MLAALPRAAFAVLAGSSAAKRLALRRGIGSTRLARRFVAGETLDDAIAVARQLEQAGIHVSINRLGSNPKTAEDAVDATKTYVAMIDEIHRASITRYISVRLTELGLHVDRATSVDNLRRILEAAAKAEFFVRIEMDSSQHTDLTMDVFETLWGIGYHHMGVVIQACLRRSEADVRRMNKLGVSVRLVKGAFREPRPVAFVRKPEIDQSFLELMRTLLKDGASPAIATHDPVMIEEAKRFADSHSLAADKYEFQMRYGIRPDLQTAWPTQKYRLRVSVPFGSEWFPYLMRRLGERPRYLFTS